MMPLQLAVCVCTYRRAAALDRLLHALTDQRWARLPPCSVTVVAVENEQHGPGEDVCRKYNAGGKLSIQYAVESQPGVPIARNRCLDIAVAWSDFIAFIDDDEIPSSDWLEQLLCAQLETGADVVSGPVLATYVRPPPSWLLRGRFHDSWAPESHSSRFSYWLNGNSFRSFFRRVCDFSHPVPGRSCKRSGSTIPWCDTGNVLCRTDIIRATGLRFDATLRVHGYGADTLFFRRLHNAGYRLVWCNEAAVRHEIPPERTTAKWLFRRALQIGFCGELAEARLGDRSVLKLLNAVFWLVWAAANIAVVPVDLIAGWHRAVWRLSRVATSFGRCVANLGLDLRYDRRQQISGEA